MKDTNIKDIEKILETIRNRRSQWRLSLRRKNLLGLAALGIDEDIAFDVIYQNLKYQDYVSGPEADNKGVPGNVWIFGLNISDVLCYLKFQDKPSGIVMWISLHPAEYPLTFPYK
ncbi:hypothetical protein L3V66_11860 [Secundilactobacillus sp. HBUAS58055]|uniref:hypothetical protein n=1 Tax=Secundilactobacillus angelensis TaxID=2722706 RepID=UPI001E426F5A|nr:hypothetical protein [Secundilactobacillus angelensis]MCH5463433.1 hypothetical protein [Secundilactobacillus angelensis]